ELHLHGMDVVRGTPVMTRDEAADEAAVDRRAVTRACKGLLHALLKLRRAALAEICAEIEYRQRALEKARHDRSDRVTVVQDRVAVNAVDTLYLARQRVVVRLPELADPASGLLVVRFAAGVVDRRAVEQGLGTQAG